MKQQTIKVGDQKIRIRCWQRTHLGNFMGFRLIVDDNRGNKLKCWFSTLFIQEAMDKAYVKFVKAYA